MKRLAVLAVCAACSTPTNDGDPFPVYVDLSQGPVLVHVARPEDATAIAATLDLLAPLTLVDPGPGVFTTERESTDLTLFGARIPGGSLLVPRAQFPVDLVLLHPCDPAQGACTVGLPAAPTPIGAVVGADAIDGGAIRFDFPASQLFILPDIAGEDTLRDDECDARFPNPFRGGGTLVLGGADVDFTGRRVAIGACLGGDPESTNVGGTEVLLVASTGIGPTLLGTTAWLRFCAGRPDLPACTVDPSALPRTTVLLPSGPVVGGKAQITPPTGGSATYTDLALVANPDNNPHGPCRDLRARHCLVGGTCSADEVAELCTKGTACGAPATVELTAALDLVVVGDDDPTLQALRAELRPDQPEVDGLLGVDALRALQLDVDYPNGRLLARCGAGQTGCRAHPRLPSTSEAASALACDKAK